jgi:Putative motility protein
MDIPALSSSMAANSLVTQSSLLVAKKSLDIQKLQGQSAIALIQGAAPELGDGNGKLVNLYV